MKDRVTEKLAKRVTLCEDLWMDGISTDEVVQRLRQSGFPVTAAGLRQDVHRGLISPLMPSADVPGRGRPARWSPMSVRRARRIARLRKRGVNGHVLPLLLFLSDGWGWNEILSALQTACAKMWEIDRRHMSHPNRVRSRDDLLDNAQDDEAWADRRDAGAIRDYRTFLYTANWYGTPDPAGSTAPLVANTLPQALSVELTQQERTAGAVLARKSEAVRTELGIAGADFGPWLASLGPDQVDRGRRFMLQSISILRAFNSRVEVDRISTNPLTLGGRSASEIAAHLRASPGRLTPAQLLAAMIAQAMLNSEVAAGAATKVLCPVSN